MYLKRYPLKVFLIAITAMTLYEVLKELFFLNINTWQSHAINILVVSCGIMLAFYFFHKKAKVLWLASTVFDTLDDAVVITDQSNRIIAVNPAFTKITGVSPTEVLGKNSKIMSRDKDQPELWNTLTTTGSWEGEIWNRRKEGEIFAEWLSVKRVCDESGRFSHHVGVFSDLSHHKASSERIQYLAHHDLLTDLPNRTLFLDRFHQVLATAKRETKRIAVLYLDIDKFKEINEQFGYDIGDLVLKEVSIRLLNCLRSSDTIARIGGDEFLVLLAAIEQAQDAMIVAENIRYALNQAFELTGHSLHISPSIGIAVYPEHGSDENLLLGNADIAMHAAKRKWSNNVQLYQTII